MIKKMLIPSKTKYLIILFTIFLGYIINDFYNFKKTITYIYRNDSKDEFDKISIYDAFSLLDYLIEDKKSTKYIEPFKKANLILDPFDRKKTLISHLIEDNGIKYIIVVSRGIDRNRSIDYSEIKSIKDIKDTHFYNANIIKNKTIKEYSLDSLPISAKYMSFAFSRVKINYIDKYFGKKDYIILVAKIK